MIVTGLDNREYKWNLYNIKKRAKVSSLHARAREILSNLFPCDIIVEEAQLPGIPRQILYVDFVVPSEKLIIEVQGEQHYRFNAFFHDNKTDFYKAVARDNLKKRFCEINDLTLIELPYTETDDEWRARISNY
jgi:hypothetical protein